MAKDTLRYDIMVEAALRGVVRDALAASVERGLPGAHHFFITFRTDFPGVDIPDFLRAQYPGEMTIVLEHQFWGLEVDQEKFGVTLSFNNQAQRLTIPIRAITAFADPSVKFGLEFRVEAEPVAATPAEGVVPSAPVAKLDPQKTDGETRSGENPPSEKVAEVVKLDSFRKK